MRVVADSQALLWFSQDSPQLSTRASKVLRDAEAGDGIVVSIASLVDLWYVTQTTQGVTTQQLSELRDLLAATSSIHLHPIDLGVADAYTAISPNVLSDPCDRFIVATAVTLSVPLVTRDGPIHGCGLIETIW